MCWSGDGESTSSSTGNGSGTSYTLGNEGRNTIRVELDDPEIPNSIGNAGFDPHVTQTPSASDTLL